MEQKETIDAYAEQQQHDETIPKLADLISGDALTRYTEQFASDLDALVNYHLTVILAVMTEDELPNRTKFVIVQRLSETALEWYKQRILTTTGSTQLTRLQRAYEVTRRAFSMAANSLFDNKLARWKNATMSVFYFDDWTDAQASRRRA